MTFKDKTYSCLLFCGDIHGVIDVIPNFLRDNGLINCAVFQVGDFGIGFDNNFKENKRISFLNKRMMIYDSDLYVIRGNHDDPKYFDGNYNLSNLFLLKDYSVVKINDLNVLGIGGAVSVDRIDRIGHKTHWGFKKTQGYWENEVVVVDKKLLEELKNINIVVTHTSPNFCYPLTKGGISNYLLKDKELNNDLLVERQHLTTIYETLIKNNDVSNWYYGHFHKDMDTYYENTKFTLIGINKIVEHRI